MLAHHYREALALSEAAGLDTTALRGPARDAFADGARRALSLNAGEAVHDLALSAVALTELNDPERPALQLLAAQGARDLVEVDTTELLEEARAGFIALDDVARAAEASQMISREALHRGDTPRSLTEGRRAFDLARSVPLSVASAHALAGRARHLRILEGSSSEAIELAREVLAFADSSGDERLAMSALGTIGLSRVDLGDLGGIDDLERAVERGRRAGAMSETTTGLNNLANCLWAVGRLDDATARYDEAMELCERYGLTAGISWLDGERVYDRDRRGDLEGALEAADHFLASHDPAKSYQTRPVLATRARVLLARGQVRDALASAEEALASFRETGYDAQIASEILTEASRCYRAVGRDADADALLAEALSVEGQMIYDLPLHLVELGRGDDYLALAEKPPYAWGEAAHAAAVGELVRASAIYGEIGARFAEAWAALLAAERGDTSRLDAALAYLEEQGAAPYVQRCRALLQASA